MPTIASNPALPAAGSYLPNTCGMSALSSVLLLDFLQRYTLAIDFSSCEGAEDQLRETNAFLDAQQADAEGVRLVLP